MEVLNLLNRRYATKKFDTNRKIAETEVALLKDAVNLSPTSYGLQLYRLLVIADKDTKEKLKPLCWNQQQIEECSHLFVFCSFKTYEEKFVDDYIELMSKTHRVELNTVKGYGDFIKKKIAEKDKYELQSWMEKQTYLAASNLMLACAELGIDSCPMEGFDAPDVDAFLQLHEKNLTASVMVATGYRHPADDTQYAPKVRIGAEQLFIRV